jgi:hypothetical protein
VIVPPPTPAAQLYAARLNAAIARVVLAVPDETYARVTRVTVMAKRGVER